MKIAVVGGGIIGLTTAYELACSGAELVLLEKGKIGGGASGAAGGILSPLQPWQCTSATISLLALSQQRWLRLFNDLSRVSQSFAPISSGILYLDPNDIVAAQRWVQEQGGVGHKLDKIALQQSVSGISATQGFLLSTVQQVVSTELMQGLKNLLQSEGVCIKENHTVDKLIIHQQSVQGVLTSNGKIEADCVVLCAGAWMSQLHPNLLQQHIRPIRGQMLEIEASTVELPHIIVSGEHYLIPRSGGRILVGSTVEDCGFNEEITAQAQHDLMGFAGHCIPTLKSAVVISQWAGLRPAPDGDKPLIGWHPMLSQLFINTGHFRNGIVLAAGSAQLAAELIVGDNPTLDASPFAVSA